MSNNSAALAHKKQLFSQRDSKVGVSGGP
jgi:hypothetical protein